MGESSSGRISKLVIQSQVVYPEIIIQISPIIRTEQVVCVGGIWGGRITTEETEIMNLRDSRRQRHGKG